MKDICHAIVPKKEKNVIIQHNGDAEVAVVIAEIAVVTVVAAVAEVASEEVEIVMETTRKAAVRELKNAGIVEKKDIWLSSVKNRKEKDPIEEVL